MSHCSLLSQLSPYISTLSPLSCLLAGFLQQHANLKQLEPVVKAKMTNLSSVLYIHVYFLMTVHPCGNMTVSLRGLEHLLAF